MWDAGRSLLNKLYAGDGTENGATRIISTLYAHIYILPKSMLHFTPYYLRRELHKWAG